MKIKTLFICFFVSILTYSANASTLLSAVTNTSQIKSTLQEPAKTEIFIDNNSDETIWVSVYGNKEFLMPGFFLRLYNNEEEINEIPIKMSKKLFSEVFFDRLVPNHTRLKVRDYLTPQSDSMSPVSKP